MSEKQNRNKDEDEDLTAFEAVLAALRPRTDGLNPRCRELLVGEARRLCFSITPNRQQDCLPEDRPGAVDVMLKHNLRAAHSSPLSLGEGQGEGCVDPAGHRFLCIHCGTDLPDVRRVRRWTWPAATAAMTSVAALLLVMLIARPGPEMAVRVADEDERPAATSAKQAVGEEDKPPQLERGRASEDWLATKRLLPPRLIPGADQMPYITLRDQVLAYGLRSWQSPVSNVGAVPVADRPLPYREELNRLFEQQGLNGS